MLMLLFKRFIYEISLSPALLATGKQTNRELNFPILFFTLSVLSQKLFAYFFTKK